MSGKDVMWAGHEGEGIDGLTDATYASGHAVDVLVDLAAATPNALDVVAIGPLTNIASAIERDPTFAGNLCHLTVMGGEFRRGWPEHNFASDVAAIARSHPLGPLMADQAERFWRWLARVVPGATGDASAAHDPAALLALVEPSLFEVAPMHVEISADGRVHAVPRHV